MHDDPVSGADHRFPPSPPRHRRGLRSFDVLLLCLLLLAVGLGAPLAVQVAPVVRSLDSRAEWEAAGRAASDAVSAAVSEQPEIVAYQGAFRLPLCRETTQDDAAVLTRAFALMRGTADGDRLYRQLVDKGVCVRVGEIAYNSAYAYAAGDGRGDWSRSYIKIAPRHASPGQVDVLASILVHEATHIERAIARTACSYDDACTVLPNGVELEEEIAAHAAEAEWWIAAYGDDGKRFAFGYDHGENLLIEAYQKGSQPFAAYVRELRGDPREGEDL